MAVRITWMCRNQAASELSPPTIFSYIDPAKSIVITFAFPLLFWKEFLQLFYYFAHWNSFGSTMFNGMVDDSFSRSKISLMSSTSYPA